MKRISAKFGIDLLIWIIATPVAYGLLVEGALSTHLESLVWTTIGLFSVKTTVLFYEQLYLQSWHQTRLRDLLPVGRAVALYTAAFAAIIYLFGNSFHVPYSVPLLEAGLVMAGLSAVRLGTRFRHDSRSRHSFRISRKAKRVLIAGAGETGMAIARQLFAHPERGMHPVGFLEDDRERKDRTFLGVKVLGGTAEAAKVIQQQDIDCLILAMPMASGEAVRGLFDQVVDMDGVECKIIPAGPEVLSEKVSLDAMRDLEVDDLLRRDLSELDMSAIAGYLYQKTVMVTGAGGYVGSELVRQLTAFAPRKVILLDNSSANLHALEEKLSADLTSADISSVIADVRDINGLQNVFAQHQPQVIFHAAAHCHEQLMEDNPAQAILNNVFATKNLAQLSREQGVERFVHISTNRAENPTAVMGASKRMAEYVVEEVARKVDEEQVFSSVRFGQLPGSSDSPVQEFKKHISRGQSIAIPHEKMSRYYIPRTEAALLVLQAAALDENGATYALEMGDPVSMRELAEDVIRLAGLTPRADVPIGITGLGSEEKLSEEPLTKEGRTVATQFEYIHAVKYTGLPPRFSEQLDELMDAALADDPVQMQFLLSRCIRDNELAPAESVAKRGFYL